MTTGDQEITARAVADRLGIDDVRAGLLPGAEAGRDQHPNAQPPTGWPWSVTESTRHPPWRGADVGIAMGSGTDIAQETDDVVLISSDLGDLVRTVQVARRARPTSPAPSPSTWPPSGSSAPYSPRSCTSAAHPPSSSTPPGSYTAAPPPGAHRDQANRSTPLRTSSPIGRFSGRR